MAETILDDESYGFRPRRSTADAIEAIFKAVSANKDCAEWVIEGDFKACFGAPGRSLVLSVDEIPTWQGV